MMKILNLEKGLKYIDSRLNFDFTQSVDRFCYKIGVPKDLIERITGNTEAYYKEWKRPKRHNDGTQKIKNGVVQHRVINPSKKDLKWIQKRICSRILCKFVYPINIQGGLKKRDNIQNARLHLGKKFHLCTDLSDFFPSVTHKAVYDRLSQIGFSPDVSRIITLLCTYDYKIPQGVSPSTYLANLVFYPMDVMLIDSCNELDLFYTRFVDDIAISGNYDFQDKTEEILQIILNSPYKVNHSKTFYRAGKAEITGIIVSNNVLNPKEIIDLKIKDSDISPKAKESLKRYKKRMKKLG
jgi:RNA-directed DNA polymerase